ncbi:MAG: AmmeMemoRadiSam system protein B [candidate division Zixibacteria bacterium]|nr:AmmeMemoRadiSam system protein B [candidate division Zixibacteria bacterium]
MKFLYSLFVISLLTLYSAVGVAQDRRPVVAGQFYPIQKDELRNAVDDYLANVPDEQDIRGELVAIIVPHAGYVYSGQTAAYSYKLLENRPFDAVILVGVSHRYPFQGISVWEEGKWITPLGEVEIDERIANELISASPLIKFVSLAHLHEHSLEVQLPFLQVVQPGVPIVPIVTGDRSKSSVDALAQAIADVAKDRNVLIVVSTDLAHYVSRDQAKAMDQKGIDCIKRLDSEEFISRLDSGDSQFCGGSGVAAVLKASKALGANNVDILHYYDSGYTTGDKSSVVSYLAAAITRKDKSQSEGRSDMTNEKTEFSLTEEEKQTLLKIARDAIIKAVSGDKANEPPEIDDPVLHTKCGAFVTITEAGQLRGCIGYTEAFKPLYQTVHECAISAALHDYRFMPLQPNELDNIHLEISVLSPLVKVENLEDIEVGKHGLMISLGSNRGLLLPQVATEYGWDRQTFLEHTCRKAGLPRDAYQAPNATLEYFTAEIFEEE